MTAANSLHTAGLRGGRRLMAARVRLLSKPGCHLCDEARVIIDEVCAELGEAYDEAGHLGVPRPPS
ncbi:MAG: hypothetical protein WKF73_16820 [Nocardioidaceae bacterium]